MRDPERIDEMLDLIREVLQNNPDLRLGQLIVNAVRMREPTTENIFCIEDGSLAKGLRRYLELVKPKE
jgi:predicted transcriptional regulator